MAKVQRKDLLHIHAPTRCDVRSEVALCLGERGEYFLTKEKSITLIPHSKQTQRNKSKHHFC